MPVGPRIRNFVALVRSRSVRYVVGYYTDRLLGYAGSTARTVALDMRYSHRLLHGDEPSRFGHLGARAVHHTSYDILDLIFAAAEPRRDDVLVDVGCGKGRVIIYWLHRGFGRRIIGLELDPDIAEAAARRFRRFERVRIVAGDAIDNIPEDGTFFYLYNPFTQQKAVEFEQRVRQLPAGQPIRVVYYNPNFLDAFPADNWYREIVPLNGRLDRGTLARFCFPVAILDRR